jgi:hypothetical protein
MDAASNNTDQEPDGCTPCHMAWWGWVGSCERSQRQQPWLKATHNMPPSPSSTLRSMPAHPDHMPHPQTTCRTHRLHAAPTDYMHSTGPCRGKGGGQWRHVGVGRLGKGRHYPHGATDPPAAPSHASQLHHTSSCRLETHTICPPPSRTSISLPAHVNHMPHPRLSTGLGGGRWRHVGVGRLGSQTTPPT